MFGQLHPPQPMLIKQVHLSSSPKAKISDTSSHKYSSQKYSARRPDVDTITAAAVNVAVHVAFDAVGNTVIGKGEEAAVCKEWLAMSGDYIESVSGKFISVTVSKKDRRIYIVDGLSSLVVPLP